MHLRRLSRCRGQKMELKCKWNLTVELAGKFQLKDSQRCAANNTRILLVV